MSNKKGNHNSIESMIRELDTASTTVHIPNKLSIININSRAQTGGSKHNSQLSSNNNNHVNKLLSMLASESQLETTATSALEANLGNSLKMSGGRVSKLSKKDELKAFFKKYKISEVNGIKAKYFIQNHGDPGDSTDPATPDAATPDAATPDTATPDAATPVTSDAEIPLVNTTTATDTEKLSEGGNSDMTTSAESDKARNRSFSGGAGMNPGFQAFLNLKKKIAEELKISNGPKAAKIAGAVQKEMKAKYTNLNAVEIAAKGLEHFKKNHDKYKKMV